MGDFLKTLDYCIEKRVFSNRVKSFIEHYKITKLEEVIEFINNPENIFKTKNYGVKTLEDLKLFKTHLEDDNFLSKVDEVYDSNPFINRIYIFCEKNKMNARAFNYIKKNEINNIPELSNLIDAAMESKGVEKIGAKTIQDLRFIQYNLIASKVGKEESYTDLREDFLINLGIVVNNIDFLKDASVKNLDLGFFINYYFDDFFSDLAKSTRVRLKVLLSLKIEEVEALKYNQYTKERVRQINKILEGVSYETYKEQISFLITYTQINYKITTYLYEFKTENFKSNFVTHEFITNVLNSQDYYIYDLIKLKKETLNELNIKPNVFYISKLIVTEKEMELFFETIPKLIKYKNYKTIPISQIFINFERYKLEILDLITRFFELNEYSEVSILDKCKIQNSKKISPINVINSFLELNKEPQSIKDIVKYARKKEGYEEVSQEFIRYIIQKNPDIFYNIGKTGFYGLKIADDQKIKSIKEECIKFLQNNPGPTHKSTIIKYFRSKNIKSNARSIEEILRMYDNFKSIGQSFFILSEDNNNYESPIHCKSILTKIDNMFRLDNNWARVSDVYALIDNVKMPFYQKNAYKYDYFFIHNNLLTEHIDYSSLTNFIYTLDNQEYGNIIVKSITNFNDYNELDLKIIADNYIKNNFNFTLNSKELFFSIKFHIKTKEQNGI